MEEASNQPETTHKKEEKKPKKKTHKKKKNLVTDKVKFWNTDKIVSLSAMAIALFTLVVLVYQSNMLHLQNELTVKQQKASVLPYLQFGDGFSSEEYQIVIENKGLGPAFIKGLYVKKKDSVFMLINFKNYYDEKNSLPIRSYSLQGLVPGVVLAPGDKLILLSAGGGNEAIKPVMDFFTPYFSGQSSSVFFIEYKSIFEDSWIIESSFQHFTKEEYGDFEIFYDKVN